MEYENYATKGRADLGIVLGSLGTAFGSGILQNAGGIFGGNQQQNNQLQMDLIAESRKSAILESELAQERKMVDLYQSLGNRIGNLEKTVSDNAAAQAVINCGMSSNIGILQTQVAQLMDMTKLVIPSSNVMTPAG